MIFGEQTKYAENLSEERLGGDGSEVAAETEMEEELHKTPSSGALDELAVEDAEEMAQGDGIVGHVEGKVVIVVDDVIDGSGPFIEAAVLLKAAGCSEVFVMATHGTSPRAPGISSSPVIGERRASRSLRHSSRSRCHAPPSQACCRETPPTSFRPLAWTTLS